MSPESAGLREAAESGAEAVSEAGSCFPRRNLRFTLAVAGRFFTTSATWEALGTYALSPNMGTRCEGLRL